MPVWLEAVAVVSLSLSVLCSLVVLIDLLTGHRQHMAVMNLVWPITALYSGPLGLWAYYQVGRLSSEAAFRKAKGEGRQPPSKEKPFWETVGLAASHCGAGCTLGDILTAWLLFLVPLSLFGRHLFAEWAVGYVLAFLFGIAFQYFTIKPMRHLSAGEGIWAALKADALSLTAWQVGMYGWMAVAVFVLFGHELNKTDPVYWFMMQLAMLAGFLTGYPVNWLLLRAGIKEKM